MANTRVTLTKAEALRLFAMDQADGRSPRGIVNARWLGLSKHRYRRPKSDPTSARRRARAARLSRISKTSATTLMIDAYRGATQP